MVFLADMEWWQVAGLVIAFLSLALTGTGVLLAALSNRRMKRRHHDSPEGETTSETEDVEAGGVTLASRQLLTDAEHVQRRKGIAAHKPFIVDYADRLPHRHRLRLTYNPAYADYGATNVKVSFPGYEDAKIVNDTYIFARMEATQEVYVEVSPAKGNDPTMLPVRFDYHLQGDPEQTPYHYEIDVQLF